MNFSAIEKYELVGCDLDTESVELAKSQAKARGVLEKTSFWQRDAWNLATEEEFDRVVSLGLNMYCEDRQSAISLYKSFWQALKPSGKLMVTYMTHTHGPNIERDLSLVSSDEKKLVAMMAEVLEIKYFNHLNSSAEIVENLKEAGFSEVSCHYSKFRALNIAVGVKK